MRLKVSNILSLNQNLKSKKKRIVDKKLTIRIFNIKFIQVVTQTSDVSKTSEVFLLH